MRAQQAEAALAQQGGGYNDGSFAPMPGYDPSQFQGYSFQPGYDSGVDDGMVPPDQQAAASQQLLFQTQGAQGVYALDVGGAWSYKPIDAGAVKVVTGPAPVATQTVESNIPKIVL